MSEIKQPWQIESEQRRTAIAEHLTELGITVASVFVPFSQSRNKGNKDRSLNWTVTVKKDGRDVLTTDYSAGIGHCPAYKKPPKFSTGKVDTYTQGQMIKGETEKGVAYMGTVGGASIVWPAKSSTPILPDPLDVLSSLVSEFSALDHASYESWAGDFGYDPDSRSGEQTYRACLEIALKMRSGLGEKVLAELVELFQDY